MNECLAEWMGACTKDEGRMNPWKKERINEWRDGGRERGDGWRDGEGERGGRDGGRDGKREEGMEGSREGGGTEEGGRPSRQAEMDERINDWLCASRSVERQKPKLHIG